jgi:MFS family permease
VTQTFQANYGFSVWKCTLIQLALSVGAFVATIINPLQDRAYLRSARKSKDGKPIPEARLYSAIPGSLLFTVGLFWYGWCSYRYLHWILPTIGIALVGLGIYSIYLAVVNYLTDSYEKYAASALSAASLGRNTFGAFLPLASPALYNNLGFQWASSLLGFIGLVLTLAPIVLFWKGEEIRRRSPFMKEATFSAEEAEERAAMRGEKPPSSSPVTGAGVAEDKQTVERQPRSSASSTLQSR